MQRTTMASALFAVALFALTAAAQNPALYRERVIVESDYPIPFQFVKAQTPAPPPKEKEKEKKADSLDAAIAAALANDPDVKVARATVQLAEAGLATARQATVLKVTNLTFTITELKTAVAGAEHRVAYQRALFERGAASGQ